MKTSSKVTANKALNNELFSLNQLVKFMTKGDGLTSVETYLIEKATMVTFADITVKNIVTYLPARMLYKCEKYQGKMVITDEKRERFTPWALLTAIDAMQADRVQFGKLTKKTLAAPLKCGVATSLL